MRAMAHTRYSAKPGPVYAIHVRPVDGAAIGRILFDVGSIIEVICLLLKMADIPLRIKLL